MIIKEGDPVIIFGGPSKVYFARIPDDNAEISNRQMEANKGNQRLIHNRNGIFDLAQCIGKKYGEKLFWDTKKINHWVVLLRPTPELIAKSITHHTQILYRADISLIVLLLDLLPGKRVVECGTGSGSLSCSLASAVAPNGHVYTFDFHDKRREYAKELFDMAKISHIISVHGNDAYAPNSFLIENDLDGNNITMNSIDGIFLDLPSPWLTIGNCTQIIKHFGHLVNFSPCIEQAQRMTQTLHENNFTDIRTFEILCKPWGISFDEEVTDEEECCINRQFNDSSFVNYQLPQLNHTGYITVGTANFIDTL